MTMMTRKERNGISTATAMVAEDIAQMMDSGVLVLVVVLAVVFVLAGVYYFCFR